MYLQQLIQIQPVPNRVLEFIEFNDSPIMRSSLSDDINRAIHIKIPSTDIQIDEISQKPKTFFNLELYS